MSAPRDERAGDQAGGTAAECGDERATRDGHIGLRNGLGDYSAVLPPGPIPPTYQRLWGVPFWQAGHQVTGNWAEHSRTFSAGRERVERGAAAVRSALPRMPGEYSHAQRGSESPSV